MRYPKYGKYNKYSNKKCSCGNGHIHDSVKEAQRCNELNTLQKVGYIRDLRYQVKYILIPAQYDESTECYTKGVKKGQPKPGKLLEKECSYYADFVYTEDGNTIVEDAKGMKTEVYKIKKKLMLKEYGIQVREV